MAGEAETTGKDQYKAANLSYMVENPSKGMDEELYKAMVVAYAHGIFGNSKDSRWDEPITKAEALQALIRVYEEAGTTIKCQNGSNMSMDISNADLSNLNPDITYTINGKEYKASDFENAGTVAFLEAYGEFPPMTYAEWQEEVSKINSAKYEIYKNHLVYTPSGTESEQLADLTNEQRLWLERMEIAISNGITDKQELIDKSLVLSEGEVDEGLDYLYYDGRLSEIEKMAYEEIYGLNEPEAVYEVGSGNSSGGNSSSSGSSSSGSVGEGNSSNSADSGDNSNSSGSADSGYTSSMVDETTNDDLSGLEGWLNQGDVPRGTYNPEGESATLNMQ